MAVERSYARLGLFLVLALIVVLGTTLVVVQRLRSRAVIPFVTYTSDNVSGVTTFKLDVSTGELAIAGKIASKGKASSMVVAGSAAMPVQAP